MERFIIFHNNKKHETRSDEFLISEYVTERKPEILGILYQRYIHMVYGVCLKYFKDRDKSKDTVIQIFEKLVVEIDKYQIANFRSWLYVMTKHHCLRILQNESSENKKFRQYSDEYFMESTIELSPLDEIPVKDLNEALKDCMEKLRNEQKICVELFYFREKCYQEIALEMDIPVNKVKSYIQNGKRNLKICLESKDERKAG